MCVIDKIAHGVPAVAVGAGKDRIDPVGSGVAVAVAAGTALVYRHEPYAVHSDIRIKIDERARFFKSAAYRRGVRSQFDHNKGLHPFGRHDAARGVARDELNLVGGDVGKHG